MLDKVFLRLIPYMYILDDWYPKYHQIFCLTRFAKRPEFLASCLHPKLFVTEILSVFFIPGPDWSSSSSIAESVAQSSFQEDFSSSSVAEYFSDEGGVFESVFEDSSAAVETKLDNLSDDLTKDLPLGAGEGGTATNKSVSAVAGRSGFLDAVSSSFAGETISSSSSSTGIAEGLSSSSDAFAEAADDVSSIAESFGSSSVAEVASSSIQEEPATVDLSTMLPTSTGSLATSDLFTPSEGATSVTGEAVTHSTTHQPSDGPDEDSILEDYSDSNYEYPDDSSTNEEESTPTIRPTTNTTTSGSPTTRSSTTTPQSPGDNGNNDDGSSIQEGDDSLFEDYCKWT